MTRRFRLYRRQTVSNDPANSRLEAFRYYQQNAEEENIL
jgi:hypothetical protein